MKDSKTLKISISGMRGLYPNDISPDKIMEIIWAFNKTLTNPKETIAIARDNRGTSLTLEFLVLGFLRALGRNVHHLGIVPTPTLKHYIHHQKLTGGIMISASHNPIEYVAFKFIKTEGFFFSQKENITFQKKLKLKNKNIKWQEVTKQGEVLKKKNTAIRNHIIEVCEEILQDVHLSYFNGMKIALDTLGACSNEIAPLLLDKLGISYVSQFPHTVEYFPRHPEPTTSSLKSFSKFVVENKCDLGFAFDPDADRLVLVDENGNIISEEYTLILSLMAVLNKRQGSIVVNYSSSYGNEWITKKHKCHLIETPVGEANVITKLLEKSSKGIFAGEGNGGVIDPRIQSLGRDSITGMAWILRLLFQKRKPISEIVREIPKTYMLKSKLNLTPQQVKSLTTKLAKFYQKYSKEYTYIKQDGIYLKHKTGMPWLHFRPSNTEPIIRLITEAQNKTNLQAFLKQIGIHLPKETTTDKDISSSKRTKKVSPKNTSKK